jgi:hypothetical protein
MKTCTKCGVKQGMECFSKHKLGVGGLSSWCKKCTSEAAKTRYQRKKSAGWKPPPNKSYIENPERYRALQREWNKKNPHKAKEYYEKHKEKRMAATAAWKQRNKDKVSEYCKKVKARNIVENRVRCRIAEAIRWRKSHPKCCSTVEYLGCNFDFFKQHIISQFTKGMTVELWESGAIQIDHIIPVCAFDINREDERHRAFHWSNTRPMWAAENISKGGRVPSNAQPILGGGLL